MNARRLLALLLLAFVLPACGDGSTAPPAPLPTAPANLSITGKTSGRVHLAWDDLSTDETGFTIERRLPAGDWGIVGAAGIDEESFVDRGLPTLTTVEYRVRPTNNPTGWSNTAVDTTSGVTWGGTVGGGPSGRSGHRLIYDTANARLVLFGGLDDLGCQADVWIMDLTGPALGAWVPVTPGGTPPAGRLGHTAIYDPPGQRMIVFGGSVDTGPDPVVNDVWELSLPANSANFVWQPLAPAGVPPSARYEHSSAFDPVRRRILIFGGEDFTSLQSDLRSLDLDTMVWTDHASPTFGRTQHSAIYDVQNDLMVVHGGNNGAGSVSPTTWLASVPAIGLATWTPLNPTPFGRTWSSAVYDEKNRRMIVFGGVSQGVNYGDVWALPLTPGGSWEQVTVGSGPGARYDASAAYDPVRERMVVFSGFNDDLVDYPDALAWPLQFGVYPP